MTRIILQPCGNKDARAHFVDTIENTVEISEIEGYLSQTELEIIKELYPEGKLRIWGVTRGINERNKKYWDKINKGDITLLSKDGQIFASTTTTFKIHNKLLARALWNENKEGNTWEFIYFVDELRFLSIPYKEFNKCVGYKENFVIQGFSILDEEKSQNILDQYNLESDIHINAPNKSELRKIYSNQELDKHYTSTVRKEQGAFRKALFRNRTKSNCVICGKEFPIQFLVCAHIKKRSKCTIEEKLDYPSIVIEMCKFGCDELFEKGYIFVKDGTIHKNNKKNFNITLNDFIDQFSGHKCLRWDSERKKYFDWHHEYHSLN